MRELPEGPMKAEQGMSLVQQAFATTDTDLILALLIQTKEATGFDAFESAGHDYIVAAVHSLGARDGVEALLATQMVAVHQLAMTCLANAAAKEQTDQGIELYVNRANRLLRTFATLVEAFRAHRGGGQQRMVVEHVTVNSGGQAIVGSVNRGGGNEKKTSE
jgi:hypothetical protein